MEHMIQNTNFKSIVKFTLPTVIMMVFMSLYQMVDAIFVSNVVGSAALSALNIVYPAISVVIAIAVMLGTGGNAIISRNMGEQKPYLARQRFSFIVGTGIVIGIVLAVLSFYFTPALVQLLGATPELQQDSITYLSILLAASPLIILQMLFQSFFVSAGKPRLGLTVTVAGGLANIIFDYIFIVFANMGVQGAALGTILGYAIPSIFGMIYFSVCRKRILYFVLPKWEPSVVAESCFNGSSEMVINLAFAVTTFLFNLTMLEWLAEDGVAGITIVLYVQFFLSSVYIGYSLGVAPVISYYYGKQDSCALKQIIKNSLLFLAINSVLWFSLSILLKNSLISVFVAKDSNVFSIVSDGWILFSLNYLITGFNIFASSMFTAFSNGKISALISFLRTFAFLCISILVLPQVLGVTGIWLSIPIAELLTLAFSIYFFFKMRIYYKY